MSGQGQDEPTVEPGIHLAGVVGEVFTLDVDDLPGAGYRWVVRDVPEGLRVLDDEVEPMPASERVGGTARRSLRLEARQAGSYEMEMVLVRSWEPASVAPAASRRLTVEVADGT